MNNFTYKTRAGITVTLNPIDMQIISKHYDIQCRAEYIEENYAELSSDMVLRVAEEVSDDLSEFISGDDETEAIERAFEKLGLNREGER